MGNQGLVAPGDCELVELCLLFLSFQLLLLLWGLEGVCSWLAAEPREQGSGLAQGPWESRGLASKGWDKRGTGSRGIWLGAF